MVDPTIQTEPAPAEPIGVAPTPQPITADPVLEVPVNLNPANIAPPPVQTASTAVEPAAVPQAPPGWIREVGNEPAPLPPAPPAPTHPPVTYAEPAHRPDPVPPEDMALNAVVQNPRGFIGGIVHEALDQRVNPAFAAMAETAGAVNSYLSAQSRVAIKNAQDNVEKLYSEVFHQDEAYNSNPNIKRDVDKTFQNLLQSGIHATRSGDFEGIVETGALTPLQANAALNAVKTLHGVTGNAVTGPNVGTAVVESPTSHAPITQTDVQITPEEENIIAFRERIDPGFRNDYIAAKKEAIVRGDFQLD